MADRGKVDREKVIKAIEICYTLGHNCTECPLFPVDDCNDKLMHDALSLLKAQEPVKPERASSGGGITWWNVCGYCKTAINPNDKFCHECGRAVKWE